MSARGTTNGNDRGSVANRRARRAWMMETYASDREDFVRCYRCGFLLFNPDHPWASKIHPEVALPLTIDRIIPGAKGGTYKRSNIRPACGTCNSSTGAKLARRGKK